MPGPGPSRIEVEKLSHTFVPKIAMVAGTRWGKVDLVRASYRLVWPDGTAIIDAGNSLAMAKRWGAATYDAAAWTRMQRALAAASIIVVTHEHPDHLGGLMESQNLSVAMAHARLTSEQIDDTRSLPLRWPAGALNGYQPLKYGRLYALAPGVVLIKAAGHTPGSQMVYVRRADGCEFVFMGDTASSLDNVVLQRIRSRYVTDHYGATHDDRRAVMLQTQALHTLAAAHPKIVLVPGHDGDAIARLIATGMLTRGFR